MNIEDLEYLQQTFEFIRNNTELIDHNRDIETYGNNMMNCENIISRGLSERQATTEAKNQPQTEALHIADVSGNEVVVCDHKFTYKDLRGVKRCTRCRKPMMK